MIVSNLWHGCWWISTDYGKMAAVWWWLSIWTVYNEVSVSQIHFGSRSERMHVTADRRGTTTKCSPSSLSLFLRVSAGRRSTFYVVQNMWMALARMRRKKETIKTRRESRKKNVLGFQFLQTHPDKEEYGHAEASSNHHHHIFRRCHWTSVQKAQRKGQLHV